MEPGSQRGRNPVEPHGEPGPFSVRAAGVGRPRPKCRWTMTEFERRISEARRAGREIAQSVQKSIDRNRRREGPAEDASGEAVRAAVVPEPELEPGVDEPVA